MRVAVDTEAAAEDTQVSAVLAIPAELLTDTVEPALAVVLVAMAGGSIHPGSHRGATAAMVVTGKGITHREARLEDRFMVLA